MKLSLSTIETIDDPVVALSNSKGIHAFHPVMRICVQVQAQMVDCQLYSGLNRPGEFEENSIEVP